MRRLVLASLCLFAVSGALLTQAHARGATVESVDVALLTEWLDWAYAEATSGK